jgi:hypothetical protein
MAIHQIDYEYTVHEGAIHEMDMDIALDPVEKEEMALADIKEMYPDITDVKIKGIDIA